MLRTTGLPLAVLGLLLFSSAFAAAEPQPYGMADLTALAGQKSWAELYEHAQDIPPSARSADWNELVEKAAAAQVTAAKDPESAFLTAEDAAKKFPFLKTSESFTAVQSSAALKHFEQCLQEEYQSSQCQEGLYTFVKDNSSNAKLGYSAADLVLRSQNHAAAVRFYALALSNSKDTEGCKQDRLWDAVSAGLSQPPDQPAAVAARELTFTRCWPVLQEQVLTALAKETPKSFYQQNTCPGLLEKKALSGLKAKMCESLGQTH